MSKRIDDLKFGAILEAISQISPFHGRVLETTMNLIDQREAEREEKETIELDKRRKEGRQAGECVDKYCERFFCIILLLLFLVYLFNSNPGPVKML